MATEEMTALSDCNTGFGLDLYSKLVEANPDKNIFFSPISISFALAMTYLGAKGQTMEQMKKAMKLDNITDDKLHKGFSEINKSLLNTEGKYILHIANRLYGEKSYKFLDEFLKNCQKYYGAELAAVDFVNNSAEAAKIINSWVEKQTNDKIKNLVDSSVLKSVTRLVLVNAIYFKGDWKQKFDAHLTREADFHTTSDQSVKVQMMFMRETKFMYSEDQSLNSQVVELPYSNKSLSMFILLPDLSKTTLDKLESSLSHESLKSLKLYEAKVKVWLPRFKLELDFNLNDNLKKLGVKDLFVPGGADLSGVDGSKQLYVSEVLHKAFIEVNEEGSEAAAATAVVMNLRCAMPFDVPEFRADHPFLFFIKDNKTGSILFYGRLVKP